MAAIEWHILDVGSIWMKEFGAALNKISVTHAWEPQISNFGFLASWERTERIAEPALEVIRFPLQRGYARPPLSSLIPFERGLLRRLKKHGADAKLICTTPYYAPVAEQWPGPVVYYVTDLTKKYATVDEKQVIALDKRMCRAATLVCPNSRRIADYLADEAECDRAKIVVLPNATRLSNIPEHPLEFPAVLPVSIADVKRPIAGVIGNLAGNMDWLLLKDTIDQSSKVLSWVFVGPTTMTIPDEQQAEARQWVMSHAHFTGPKPYGELQAYARAFDVAILPYRKHEPTYSGSSTRFYEHLPACRPMIGTRGFAELLEKEPLITLVDTAYEMAGAIAKLEGIGFQDGHEHSRWIASSSGTWEYRAETMVNACAQMLR